MNRCYIMNLDNIINHCRYGYETIERSRERVVKTAEVFTSVEKVNQALDLLPQELFQDPDEYFLDYCAGEGAFVTEALIRKCHYMDYTTALRGIFAVELESDNCEVIKRRLLCGSTDPIHLEIVNRQVVQADARIYHMRFDGTPASDTETIFNRNFTFD
jgi:hypothetical protein